MKPRTSEQLRRLLKSNVHIVLIRRRHCIAVGRRYNVNQPLFCLYFSQSIVQFNSAQWAQIESGRYCVSYIATPNGRAILQPEFCAAGHPFICYKEIPADTEVFYRPENSKYILRLVKACDNR